jgi:hypothetical protein
LSRDTEFLLFRDFAHLTEKQPSFTQRTPSKTQLVGDATVVRGVPMKTEPPEMAQRLLAGGDRVAALKRVKEELSTARRARSRHRYAYWAAVEAALCAGAARSGGAFEVAAP